MTVTKTLRVGLWLGLFLILCSNITLAQPRDPLVVESGDDDGSPGTLRAAILQALATPEDDEITFNFLGETVIFLTGDLPAITAEGGALTIDGSSTGFITVNGNESFRPFTVTGGNLTLRNLVVTDGFAPEGGAVYNDGGTVTIEACQVYFNDASGAGGAIQTVNGGSTSVIYSEVTGNKGLAGGGIHHDGASLTLLYTTLGDNIADGIEGGGGLMVQQGDVQILNSLIVDNGTYTVDTGNGGGLRVLGGSVTIINTAISANDNLNTKNPVGAGILAEGGSVTLINATVADHPDGGALYQTGTATITVGNTLFSNNDGSSCVGTIEDLGNNLEYPTNSCGFTLNALLEDPLMLPLDYNGGPTLAYTLEVTSPAIDAGNIDLLPEDTFDLDGDGDTTEKIPFEQRGDGFARLLDDGIDIGSIEQALPLAGVEILVNGDFEDGLAPWELKHSKGAKAKIKCNTEAKTIAYDVECAFQFRGGAGAKSNLAQTVQLAGRTFTADDELRLSLFVNASKVDTSGKVKLTVQYGDETPKSKLTLPLLQTSGYEEVSGLLELDSMFVTKIKLQIKHTSPAGKVLLDAVSLELIQPNPPDVFIPLP